MTTDELKKLSDEEIDRLFHENPSNEDVFEEYHSRLNWRTPPAVASEEEEKQWLEQMIAEKTA
ncbi:MAG TPA: hypothetical protein ACFCUY_08700 [Xenococcaceae cyanobacterium]